MSGLSGEELARRTGSTFGQTVSLASRIADYARPRQVWSAATSLCVG